MRRRNETGNKVENNAENSAENADEKQAVDYTGAPFLL